MSVSNKLLYTSVFNKSLSRIASSHLPHHSATEWVVISSSLGRLEKLGTKYLKNLPKMEELGRALAWVVQITPEPAPWILFTFLHSGPTSLCFGSSKMALKSSIYSLHIPWARALVLVSCTLSKTQHRCSKSEKENKSICPSIKAACWAGETEPLPHWLQWIHLHSHLKQTDAPKHRQNFHEWLHSHPTHQPPTSPDVLIPSDFCLRAGNIWTEGSCSLSSRKPTFPSYLSTSVIQRATTQMYIFNEIHSQEKLSSSSYICYDIHFILFNT